MRQLKTRLESGRDKRTEEQRGKQRKERRMEIEMRERGRGMGEEIRRIEERQDHRVENGA